MLELIGLRVYHKLPTITAGRTPFPLELIKADPSSSPPVLPGYEERDRQTDRERERYMYDIERDREIEWEGRGSYSGGEQGHSSTEIVVKRFHCNWEKGPAEPISFYSR